MLVIFDVCSLYTNIPHELGLRAIESFVCNYRQSMNWRFTAQFILEAPSFILSNNLLAVVLFGIQGTAMGTIFALICGTLFMGYQDKELYAIIRNMLTRPISNYFEQNWQWFLDDCFIFLRVSLIKPDELLDVLNNINAAMQFTMETRDSQKWFLIPW